MKMRPGMEAQLSKNVREARMKERARQCESSKVSSGAPGAEGAAC